MPVFKQRADLVVRNIRAFLNLEAGVTRVGGAGSQQPQGVGNQAGAAVPVGNGRAKAAPAYVAGGNGTGVKLGAARAENVVWIFGSGRSGSTWLSSMMGDMGRQTLWGEP